jgi:NADPH:quinone reductase
VLGTNIAGTVEKTASDVSYFKAGDVVFGLGNPSLVTPDSSGLQEYAVLDAKSAARDPKGYSVEDMVTFPVNATTSAAALFNEKGFGLAAPFPWPVADPASLLENEDKTLVIIGGGSNVGKLGIMFARLAGVGKIIAVASSKNEAHLKELGATHVVDRHLDASTIRDRILGIAGEGHDGAQYVYDCVSWDGQFALPISLLSKTKSSVLLTLHPPERAVELAQQQNLPARVSFVLGTAEFLQPLTADFWRALPQWIEEGQLWIPKYGLVDGLDLKGIEEGLDSYRDGSSVPTVIVRPNHDICQ